jgi:hypothetical protein
VASSGARPKREPEAEGTLLRDRIGVKVAISHRSAIPTAFANGEVRTDRLRVVIYEPSHAERPTFFLVGSGDEQHIPGRWILKERDDRGRVDRGSSLVIDRPSAMDEPVAHIPRERSVIPTLRIARGHNVQVGKQ